MAAGQFYRGDDDNAIGAPARILVSPASNPHPTRISNIIASGGTPTYNPVLTTYGWVDLGLTNAPFSMQHGASVQEWQNQQYGTFRTVPDNWRGQIGSTFIEITQANKGYLMGAKTATDPVANEHRTDFTTLTSFDRYHVACVWFDHKRLIHASYFPQCEVNLSSVQQTVARGQMHDIPVQWTAFPDDGLLAESDGLPVIRVDFDQY